jgi:hypothetical protein
MKPNDKCETLGFATLSANLRSNVIVQGEHIVPTVYILRVRKACPPYHEHQQTNMKTFIPKLILACFSLTCLADTPQTTRVDTDTGARTWEIHTQGVYFSLTQILPEQAQAFYVNRGFTLEQIKPYTASCVYMTVLRNDDAPGTVHFVSNNWSILVKGKPHARKSVDDWIQTLSTPEAKPAALVAFRWAQFPIEQEYEPGGDWNQGMLSIGLPPGSEFDVIARWDIAGKAVGTKLQGVQCAR